MPRRRRASTASGYIDAICARVRQGITTWQATGRMPPDAAAAAAGVRFKLEEGASAAAVDPSDLQRRLGAGRPLEQPTRVRMGAALGADLSGVRVHDDEVAAGLTGSLRAHALAVGEHIAFGRNQYEPGTPIGDALIAHELAHVVQQSAGGSPPSRTAPETALEADADTAAAGAVLTLHGGGGAAARRGPALRSRLALQRCGYSDAPPPVLDPTKTPSFDQPPLTSTGPAPAPVVPPAPQLTLAEMGDRLTLAGKVIDRIEQRYKGDPGTDAAVTKARAAAGGARAALTPASAAASAATIDVAQQVLDRTESMLGTLDQMGASLAAGDESDKAKSGYAAAIDKVRAGYLDALASAFTSGQVKAFDSAEQAAARLPRALTDVDLKIMEHQGPPYNAVEQQDQYIWIQWTRAKLDELDADAKIVAQARSAGAADLSDREQRFAKKAELVQLSLQGLEDYERALQATKYVNNNVIPGVAFDAWALLKRCKAMHEAAVGGDLDGLRDQVTRYANDPDIAAFYKHLPLFRFGSDFAVRFGIALVAAAVTAGVGGIVTGAIGETTTLAGGALASTGTAAVEALTFTVVNRGLQTAVGQKTEGSALADFAWNFGLFTILRGTASLVKRGAMAAELPKLAGGAMTAVSFPLMHGYGLLRFRLSEGRWPTADEYRTMTADSLLTFLALASAMGIISRWLPAGKKPSPLREFCTKYGWRFETLDAGRTKLLDDFTQLVGQTKAGDPAALEALKARAKILENAFASIKDEIAKDPSIDLQAIREELAKAGKAPIEGQSALLAKELNVPETVGLRRQGEREYTFAWGKISQLSSGLRALGARVEISVADHVTGQKTLTVTFPGDEVPLTFEERTSPYPAAQEVDVDPTSPEVTKLMSELSITDPAAGRELIRMLQVERAKGANPGTAAKIVRRAIEAGAKTAATNADGYLKQQATFGVTALTTANPKLMTAAEQLVRAGILNSPEWLELRDEGEYSGLVGERMAVGQALGRLAPGQSVMRNVQFIGSLFDDAALTKPHVTGHGRPAVGIDVVPELDLLGGQMTGGDFEWSTVSQVKTVGAKRSGRAYNDALNQNAEALQALRAHQAGKPFQRADGTWARVTKVVAIDAATNGELDLTGKLKESPSVIEETIGPQAKGAGGPKWTSTLPYTYQEIETIVKLLRERQAMSAPGY